jgi:outer membrane protein assembly factor BamE (lipoprotein component of BamABCDE complex)
MKLLILFALFFIGCATNQKMNELTVGMSKQEVIAILGPPETTSAQDDVEYLSYKLAKRAYFAKTKDYYVRIIKGKLESFGKVGDFDSRQPTTIRIENR